MKTNRCLVLVISLLWLGPNVSAQIPFPTGSDLSPKQKTWLCDAIMMAKAKACAGTVAPSEAAALKKLKDSLDAMKAALNDGDVRCYPGTQIEGAAAAITPPNSQERCGASQVTLKWEKKRGGSKYVLLTSALIPPSGDQEDMYAGATIFAHEGDRYSQEASYKYPPVTPAQVTALKEVFKKEKELADRDTLLIRLLKEAAMADPALTMTQRAAVLRKLNERQDEVEAQKKDACAKSV